jgi:hypothetical protein
VQEPPKPPATEPDPTARTATDDPTPTPTPPRQPGGKHRGEPRGEPKTGADEAIPAEVAETLKDAEDLLDKGDYGSAVRRARQSFFVRKTDRGWALLTRAFCAQGDLENAKASFRNLHGGGPERGRVIRACKGAGIDLR